MSIVKIKDEEELVRDQNSNAVLNSSLSSLEQYRARRNRERQKDEELQSLKNDINEIKQLLKKLIE